MWLLLALGCAESDPPVDTSGWATIYGHVRQPTSDDGLAGVEVVDTARPGVRGASGADGRWEVAAAPEPYVTLRFTKAGYLPVQAWIAPEEAIDPAHEYPMRMGDEAVVSMLYANFGGTYARGRGVLFVDAMDPGMSDIFGATVEISSAHDGVWREDEDGTWVAENLTNEDRADLLFVNVAPGPVTITMVAPDGTPCELPPDLVVLADEITQVSGYCTYVQPHDPADTAEDH